MHVRLASVPRRHALWLLSRLSRIPRISLVGVVILIWNIAYYSYAQRTMRYFTPEIAGFYNAMAYLYLIGLLVGTLAIGSGLLKLLKDKISLMKEQSIVALAPTSLFPYLLGQKRYRRIFIGSLLLYGIFYSLITSTIVYQATVNFSEVYAASIPSIRVTTCCGPPLYVPILTVYLTEHLALLLIPMSLILLAIVSTLVAANVTLAAYAYCNRPAKGAGGWLAGLGALVGLFTGCPTCAGLFLAYAVGGASAVGFATLLAYDQPLFIGTSVPLLFVTLFFTTRSLRKVFRGGCIVRWLPVATTPLQGGRE